MKTALTLLLVLLLFGCKQEPASREEAWNEAYKRGDELWVKADAGDKSARRKFGELFWELPGSGIKDNEMRSKMIRDFETREKNGEKARELQRLFNKADLGDRDAKGDAAMMTYGELFRVRQQVRWGTNEHLKKLMFPTN